KELRQIRSVRLAAEKIRDDRLRPDYGQNRPGAVAVFRSETNHAVVAGGPRVEAPIDASAIADRPDSAAGVRPQRVEPRCDEIRGHRIRRRHWERRTIDADVFDGKVVTGSPEGPADLVRSRMGKPEREGDALPSDGVIEGLGHVAVDVASLAETAGFRERGHVPGRVDDALAATKRKPHRPTREVSDDFPLWRFRDDAEPSIRISRKLPEPFLFRDFGAISAREERANAFEIRLCRRSHSVGYQAVFSQT